MTQNQYTKNQIIQKVTKMGDIIFSAFIFATMLALFVYTGIQIYHFFLGIVGRNGGDIIHNIAYIIVLMKAYKILLHYFQYHHLSIKYLVQISIIAPAIEVIFAANTQHISINILFALYSLINLIIYVKYNTQLQEIGY